MSEASQWIDTDWRVETPEGIDLHIQVAGPVPRALAYLLDFLVRGLVLAVASLVLLLLGTGGTGITLIIAFLLEWFYPVVFEVWRNGQTPGKKAIGIATINDDLTPVTFSASFIRNLLRSADMLPFMYLFGLVSMLLNRQFRRLGDLAAGTLVVHRSPVIEKDSLPDAEIHTPDLPMDHQTQLAVIDFTRRHTQLSQSRQRELAGILTPVLNGRDEDSVGKLQGTGLWLLGKGNKQ